ncbi:unnamed protein product [Orchesella dallaii]|uniref:Uncharacterized protein n=1 Tax=Orchesella dallaii TaxID=48710 RepID=A0ABP1S3F7_9HEXA
MNIAQVPVVLLVVFVATSLTTSVDKIDDNKIGVKDSSSLDLTSGNRSARALLDSTLPFVMRELGLIECTGFDHSTHIPFFETVFGQGVDFGGNYLCMPTCGGDCVPKNHDLHDAPISAYYPFGCRCPPSRCDARGPLIADMGPRVPFKVICVRDKRCTCSSMGPPGTQTGYLCNWINLDTKKAVTFLDQPLLSGYAPTFSPVRYCSCCPA